LVDLSKYANRYQLENGNRPTESSLPRADSDAMEEFVENIRMVIGILGYSILEPILKSKISIDSSGKTMKEIEDESLKGVKQIAAPVCLLNRRKGTYH